MDHVLSDLQERFARKRTYKIDHNRAVYCLSTIIPAFVNQYAFEALLLAVEMYQAFIDDSHDKASSEPSLSCGSNAGMLQRNHPRLH